jgi:hypothetical protein
MPSAKPRKTIFDSNEFTGPDHWTKPTSGMPLTAVEKAELARLRIAAPTLVPAFAEARARRLAELEGRYAAESDSALTPAWNKAQARQHRAERNIK